MPTVLTHLRPLDAGDWAELEAAVGRFASAWQRAERPVVADHRPAGGRVRLPLLVELVHSALELRLKAGEPARVEEYLHAHPELADDGTTVLGLIAAEWEFRRRADPAVSAAEYLNRFPAHAAELADGLKRTTVDARDTLSRTPPPAADVPPAVPGYEIVAPLGRDGMGVVYRARQLSLEARPAAGRT